MANHFILTLDTTRPVVEIYAPDYTVKGQANEIVIMANEQLKQYQEIYVTDSVGNKYNLTFLHEGNSFRGLVDFGELEGFANGILTIHATVKDKVENTTTVSKTINLISGVDYLRLKLNTGYKRRNATVNSIKNNYVFAASFIKHSLSVKTVKVNTLKTDHIKSNLKVNSKARANINVKSVKPITIKTDSFKV